ncbi:hypothetical protein ACFQFC_18915 [Amorphoplanes digitatis]|uniref:Uncharacterized protein n=1 Tax=Actinoplanes digitatis TaxID=1868 RepID=A0A7W7I4M2_9ACTN|nr:hypothetical protein [Actinoplanes digitatis]MBB4766289.1 hypothetical protein [Actinoplanes digitatis]GID95938.1 hypothetical protein Adi01nite_53500 [Actinoplanes digitatis]
MDISRLPESMRARIEARNALSSLDRVREFLGSHVQDADGLDEVRADLRRTAHFGTVRHHGDLAALEAVVAEQHPPGTLARLVGWEANWVLDDPSDAGAARFLTDLAEMLREVIGEVER